jgi:hypothetical protein
MDLLLPPRTTEAPFERAASWFRCDGSGLRRREAHNVIVSRLDAFDAEQAASDER